VGADAATATQKTNMKNPEINVGPNDDRQTGLLTTGKGDGTQQESSAKS